MTQLSSLFDRFALTAISLMLVASLPMAAVGFVARSL